MNDSRNEIRALWCRQLSGEPLTERESEQLRDALRGDRDLQQELSDDATSHSLLLSVKDVAQTEDRFVQAVMQQTTTVQGDPVATENSTSPLPVVETNSVDSSKTTSPGLSTRANSQLGNSRRGRSRQRAQRWTAFLLTFVLFLSVGLIVWFQSPGQGPSEIAGTGPSAEESAVKQKPKTPLKGDRPEIINDRNVATTDDVSPAENQTSDNANNTSPQLATNENTPAPSPFNEKPANSNPPNMIEEIPPTVPAQLFATLTKVEDPVWERDDTVGSRLGDEVVRLFGGTIELTFDDGAVVTLQGPVEFQPRTAGLLDLRRGQLSASVPKPAIGFTVITPTSEVVDLGTEFDVSVKDTGASDVMIRKGEVEVAPGGRTGKNIQQWKLVPGGLNHASFYARPGQGKPGPIVAKVQGARGQFQAIISLGGKTAKFRSEDTFNNVHKRVMTQLKNPQNGMNRQWQDFVDSMQGKMRGTMNFNGRQMPFGNLDEVMRLHNQLQNQLNIDDATPFKGSININGKVIEFKTQEEFEAARRTAFGPAATFGAGDIFDRKSGPR